MDISLKGLAHLGDAVYEVFIRELVVQKTSNMKKMHDLSSKYVRAEFQAELINKLDEFWSDDEKEFIRRGKNITLSVGKRNNQQIHRCATAFEVVIGYNYLNNKDRLNAIYDKIFSLINFD